MAKQLFENNAAGTLASTTAGFLANGATSMTLTTGDGNYFPNPTGGDWFLLTLYEIDTGSEVNYEVVKCTARATDVLTIERDVEGIVGVSGGRSFPTVGGRTVHVELRFTQLTAEQFLQGGDIGSAVQAYDTDLAWLASNLTTAGRNILDDADTAAQRTTLGLGAMATQSVPTGLVKGDGTTASAATANTDYATPAYVAAMALALG